MPRKRGGKSGVAQIGKGTVKQCTDRRTRKHSQRGG